MPGVSCYPLKWKTIYEFYQDAGVSWQVYQDQDNFDDNPLAWFEQYQTAPDSSPLAQKGVKFVGLDSFYAAAANGTLPEVSFIVGPMELSEHPPYRPKDGAWLQKQVVDAVVKSPKYSKTLLMISYDGMYSPLWRSFIDRDQKPVALATMWFHSTLLRVRRVNGWRIRTVCLARFSWAQASEFRSI